MSEDDQPYNGGVQYKEKWGWHRGAMAMHGWWGGRGGGGETLACSRCAWRRASARACAPPSSAESLCSAAEAMGEASEGVGSGVGAGAAVSLAACPTSLTIPLSCPM